MRLILAILISLVFVSPALSQGARGPHGMAIQSENWNCNAWFSTFAGAAEVNFPYLHNTFGNRTSCLAATLSLPQSKIVQLILTNYPGLKNRRLQPHEAMYGYDTARFCRGLEDWETETIVRVQNNAAAAFYDLVPYLRPQHELWINPDLESGCDAYQQGQYIRAIRPIFETLPVAAVRFVSYGTLAPGADFYEADHGKFDCHGDPRCIKTNDGSPVTDWRKFFSGTYAAAWGHRVRSNCLGVGPWIFPVLRKNCWNLIDANYLRAHMPKVKTKPSTPLPPAPTPRPTPFDPPALDFRDMDGCAEQTHSSDGPGNFVWKESETKRNRKGQKVAIAVFSTRFKKPARFKRVFLMRHGVNISEMTFVYHLADGTNRQVWRTEIAPLELPFYPVLHADNVCTILANPKTRND